MTPILQIFLTSALTIFGGIFVLVAGQIAIRFLIEPIHEQKKLIGEISDALILYANAYSNPGTFSKEKNDEVSKITREKASLLRARTHSIPFYNVMAKMKLVRSMSDIDKASRNLIGLSNSVYKSGDGLENAGRSDAISKALGIPIME